MKRILLLAVALLCGACFGPIDCHGPCSMPSTTAGFHFENCTDAACGFNVEAGSTSVVATIHPGEHGLQLTAGTTISAPVSGPTVLRGAETMRLIARCDTSATLTVAETVTTTPGGTQTLEQAVPAIDRWRAFSVTFFDWTTQPSGADENIQPVSIRVSTAGGTCVIDDVVYTLGTLFEGFGCGVAQPPVDGSDAIDAMDVDSTSGRNEFGQPCIEDGDCISGVCLPIGRCSRQCSTDLDCPSAPSWTCESVLEFGSVCNCTPTSSVEIGCNGIDDNCDGLVDDHDRNCGGMCVDLLTSVANCGACGVTCPAFGACVDGTCVCSSSRPTLCGTTCADTSTDVANCGACGRSCVTGQRCVSGRCLPPFTGVTGVAWEPVSGIGCPPASGFSDYTPSGWNDIWATSGTQTPVFAAFDLAIGVWRTPSTPFPLAGDSNTNFAGAALVGTHLFLVESGAAYRFDLAGGTGGWSTVATALVSASQAQNAHDDNAHVYTVTSDARVATFDVASSAVSYVTLGGISSVRSPRAAWDSLSARLLLAPAFDAPSLLSFDPSTTQVNARAAIPSAAMNHIFCSDRSGHLYAGGSTGTHIFQYTTATDTWARVPDLPFDHGMDGACTVTDSGFLYVSDGTAPTPSVARLRLM